jgi:tetratricopeptide (TPR) repeat protein
MNDLLSRLDILEKEENYEELYSIVEEELQFGSHTSDVWIKLAIAIIVVPIVDYEKSIACLEKALAIEHNNPLALIVLAHVYEYQLGGINDMLLHRIKNIHTDSDEINSMLKYVASWSYSDGKKDDHEREEQLLKESIKLWDKHVWNYMHLVRLYIRQKRYLEIDNLVYKALSNIKKIYDGTTHPDVTDIDEYINEHIKGIYITSSNVEFIQKSFVPKHIIILYTIITPFLSFYNLVKKVLRKVED